MLMAGVGSSLADSRLADRHWVHQDFSQHVKQNGYTIQGGALCDSCFYQFYDNAAGYKVFDARTGNLIRESAVTLCDNKLSCGCASFSNQFSYASLTDSGNDTVVTTTVPLVYLTGHYAVTSQDLSSYVTGVKSEDVRMVEVVSVIDLENNHLVRQYYFDDRTQDIAVAWDFENNRFWVIGYPEYSLYAQSNLNITPYEFDDTDPRGYRETGSTVKMQDAGLLNGLIQDCKYVDGHIYLLVGAGVDKSKAQYVKILDIDADDYCLTAALPSMDENQAQALAYDKVRDRFIVTTSSNTDGTASMWMLENHGGAHTYDADGFCACADCKSVQPAIADYDGTYQIRNSGNLFWFAEQCNACYPAAALNAVLTTDIHLSDREWMPIGNMVGTDAAPGCRYTGTFDGQGHWIDGFKLTPRRNNAGLFGCVGAKSVVRNFSIKGIIQPSTSVSNVGTIGYVWGTGIANSYTYIEDVHSKVDISASAELKGVGGIVGAAGSGSVKVNRCSYTGTMQLDASKYRIGGIVGDGNTGYIDVSNCLFAGSIVANGTSSSVTYVGGISAYFYASTNSITNSLSIGSITCASAASSSYVSSICGCYGGTVSSYRTSGVYYLYQGLQAYGRTNANSVLNADSVSIDSIRSGAVLKMLGTDNWMQKTDSLCSCPFPASYADEPEPSEPVTKTDSTSEEVLLLCVSGADCSSVFDMPFDLSQLKKSGLLNRDDNRVSTLPAVQLPMCQSDYEHRRTGATSEAGQTDKAYLLADALWTCGYTSDVRPSRVIVFLPDSGNALDLDVVRLNEYYYSGYSWMSGVSSLVDSFTVVGVSNIGLCAADTNVVSYVPNRLYGEASLSSNDSVDGLWFEPQMWSTICLPFDVDSIRLAGLSLYDFTGASETERNRIELEFSEVTDLKANHPYLVFNGLEDTIVWYSFGCRYLECFEPDTVSVSISAADSISEPLYKGQEIRFAGSTCRHLLSRGSAVVHNQKLIVSDDSLTLDAMRCHFFVSDSSDVLARVLFGDEEEAVLPEEPQEPDDTEPDMPDDSRQDESGNEDPEQSDPEDEDPEQDESEPDASDTSGLSQTPTLRLRLKAYDVNGKLLYDRCAEGVMIVRGKKYCIQK